jgi:iron complex outermembrane receptor protein
VLLPLPTGPVPVGSVGIARNVYYYHNYGLSAQATYKLTDQFSITAGIRNTWDWQKEDADNVKVITSAAGPLAYSCSRAGTPQLTPAPAGNASLLTSGACTRTFTTKSSKPTWTIDLEYKPTPDILVFAKYSRGYRGGGINEANIGAETWKPEFVDDYELGLKTSFRGSGVSGTFNVDGFWNEFRDQQASVFIPQCAISPTNPACTRPAFTGLNGIQNVGKSRLRGVEVDATLLLLDDNLRFDLGYAYLDAKVTGGSVPTCDNASFLCGAASFLLPGSILPYAPKHRLTIAANYTLPISADVGKISIGGTYTYTSTQYSGHANDAAFAAGKIPFNASLNPATNLVTLNMNWSNVGGSPVDIGLFATNVTNEKYYLASGNSLATTGAESIVLGEPRMYGMRVKVHFGN